MSRKGGLGKGLGALIPNGFPSGGEGGASFVSVDKIFPNPRQPRREWAESELADLAQSIREHGILQPLIATYNPDLDQYTLIAGERRLRAAGLAGLSFVPIIVREATDQERLELALIENLQRADLSPMDTALAYVALNDEFNLTHEEIGVRVGKSREAVSNTIRLVKLPLPVRLALSSGQISEGHARALLGLEGSPQAQVAALDTILKNGLTVRQTEDLVRKFKGEKPAVTEKPIQPPEVQEIEDRLRNALGTRVIVRHGRKGGRLIIHYYSDEEFDSLLGHLLHEAQ
jgi:ParB family transcriptional regulator, chromosome partitioning protein